jgi:signal transduction histidine kinase
VIVGGGQNFPAGSSRSKAELEAGTPILVNGKQVGTLLTASRSFGLNAEEARFLLRTNRALIYAALIGIVVAMLIGIFLARTFTRPLRDLNQAAQKIGAGQLEQEVPVRSQDEIGQLAGAFNRMSREIARVNQQRRQMTADIAHDLRTPLQVIAGYVEAMRDGVLQPTPERMDLITSEIERLQRMVSDLRTLSQADAGELPLHTQAIEPASLLQAAAARFQHQASQSQVALTAEAPGGLPALQVDEARLSQVLDNLVSNALRYTPAGGRIRLSARGLPGRVELKVQDSGSGIAPEEIGLIFNRFHRSDRSRHAEDGESGLGLSIVKALVEAHGGTVRAESAPGEGTAMIIELPAAQG